MISVLILTKNEEANLPGCLSSVSWCDDIHILDSGSTDETLSIAQEFGASIAVNQFESFGKQRNFALDCLQHKYEWVLFLDADERVSDLFYNEMSNRVKQADEETAGFYCCCKMMLEDKWLKHCDNFPKWQLRLVKKGMCRFTDFGHGQKEKLIKGGFKYIKEPYLHYSFSKGWFDWIERHNKYSSKEAKERLTNCPPFKNIFSANSSIRNPALRSWVSRMPGWPLLRFIYTYFFNLGFIEGRAGFVYCCSMAYYEFLIQVKIMEIKRRLTLNNELGATSCEP